MRDYVRRLLSGRYEVTAVANGEDALRSALAQPPDLVLTDVMMPRLDGFGLLAALRSHDRTKTQPVLMLSARAGEESRLQGLGAGADDYLVKPFTARELLARVEAHLSLARMRRDADQARRISELRLGLALEQNAMMAWQWDPVKDEVTSLGDVAGSSAPLCAPPPTVSVSSIPKMSPRTGPEWSESVARAAPIAPSSASTAPTTGRSPGSKSAPPASPTRTAASCSSSA